MTTRFTCRRCGEKVAPEAADVDEPSKHKSCAMVEKREKAQRAKRQRERLFVEHGPELLETVRSVVQRMTAYLDGTTDLDKPSVPLGTSELRDRLAAAIARFDTKGD